VCLSEEHAPGVGKVHPAGAAIQQPNAELAFQLCDRARQRRLGDAKAFGGPPEMTLLSDGNEITELACLKAIHTTRVRKIRVRRVYLPAAGGLINHGEANGPSLAAEPHAIARGKQMIGKLWAYLALIANEGRRAYDGRRHALLDQPPLTQQWMTLEQCREAERAKRGTRG
jgi:hypothetical protein